ncbi:hypothetical protein GCM10011316_23790 [Roseibium aquae]|uniref:PhiE125 gp8 family phage protein n=1 Tax=Roseibium aquae TaxID=1323746 RepID=A0A916TMZ4_9HYPH|nr:head-tail connector protein [Roseibium aquae]GGB50966.1 hypothetical protein GCM10011316_23790 [Roseibium aquae]
MTSALVTAPSAEPVSLSEMKAQLRLVSDAEDGLVTGLIASARQYVERTTRRALITQGWRLYLDNWPPGRVVRLPLAPVRSIGQILVFGEDGTGHVLPGDAYTLDRSSDPARLRVRPGAGPSTGALMGVEIDFTAGYGDGASDVPADLRQAIRLLAAHWFEHREAGTETVQGSLPFGLDRLLASARVPLL